MSGAGTEQAADQTALTRQSQLVPLATFEAEGIRLNVLQLGNLDLTSSSGALMVKLLAAAADFERELIIERTRQVRHGPGLQASTWEGRARPHESSRRRSGRD